MKALLIKILPWLIAAIALIGFFDATYLTAKHFIGGTVPCFITTGCDTVTTSQYAVVAGIPLALLGALYYLALFVLALIYAESKKSPILKAILVLSGLGFLSSLYLVYLQIYIIEAICFYCMISASVSTLAFILSLIGNTGKLKEYA